jgi:acyl-CoA thioesterase-1
MRLFDRRPFASLMASAALIAAALSAACPGRAAPLSTGGSSCPAAHVAGIALPHVRAVLARNHELLIVALGSSSTVSWMATDIGHSYPAILQDELNQRLPNAQVAVINRGVGGQGVIQEVARLDTDVLPIRPQLVIWQVGANDAMQDVNPGLFRRLLQAGVQRLLQAGIDVVLMDNQRSPRILAARDSNAIEQQLADVADQTGAEMFSRGALMDQWQAEGYPYASFIAADRLHHNDRGYRCIADAVADAITKGLAMPAVRTGPDAHPIRPLVQVGLTKVGAALIRH